MEPGSIPDAVRTSGGLWQGSRRGSADGHCLEDTSWGPLINRADAITAAGGRGVPHTTGLGDGETGQLSWGVRHRAGALAKTG